jgi:hypothetical protein
VEGTDSVNATIAVNTPRIKLSSFREFIFRLLRVKSGLKRPSCGQWKHGTLVRTI